MTQFVTTSQVATLCGVTVRTVHRWVATGRIVPAHRLPGETGALLFDPADVDAIARERALELATVLDRLTAARQVAS